MGMTTCPPLVVLLLVGREGDETLNYGGAHRRVGGGVASSSIDLREGAACRSSLTEAQLLGVRPRGGGVRSRSRALMGGDGLVFRLAGHVNIAILRGRYHS